MAVGAGLSTSDAAADTRYLVPGTTVRSTPTLVSVPNRRVGTVVTRALEVAARPSGTEPLLVYVLAVHGASANLKPQVKGLV